MKTEMFMRSITVVGTEKSFVSVVVNYENFPTKFELFVGLRKLSKPRRTTQFLSEQEVKGHLKYICVIFNLKRHLFIQ